MTHVVTGNCRGCRFTDCVETCPVACFHASDSRVFIDSAVCIDCGACVEVCPVHAIVEGFDLDAGHQVWVGINASESKKHPVLRTKQLPLPGAEGRRNELGL